jgi:hypothetical protein
LASSLPKHQLPTSKHQRNLNHQIAILRRVSIERPRCPIGECMKVVASSRKTELLCDAALVVALLYGGCRTAMILHALTTPLPKRHMRIDAFDEIPIHDVPPQA